MIDFLKVLGNPELIPGLIQFYAQVIQHLLGR